MPATLRRPPTRGVEWEFERLTIAREAGALPDGIVDMSGVVFCDSTGMNVLLSSLRRAKERGGQLELAAPRPGVRKILQVTGLDSVFTVLDESVVASGQ